MAGNNAMVPEVGPESTSHLVESAEEFKDCDSKDVNDGKAFTMDGNPPKDEGLVVTFSNVSCTIMPTSHCHCLPWRSAGEGKTILNPVSGVFYPGEVVGILGPSGAGKTTLLDILAGRKSVGRVTGEIRCQTGSRMTGVNKVEKEEEETGGGDRRRWGRRMNKLNTQITTEKVEEVDVTDRTGACEALARNLGYVPQDDAYLPMLTVREMLTFHSKMRSPKESREERTQKIQEILIDIGLDKMADTRIGGINSSGVNIRGISGGEKRRLSLGCCLLGSPKVIFLDEFTTGLDSYNALHMMTILSREAATKNVTIAATIHQPQFKIWQMLSSVFILSSGHLVYAGSPSNAYPWFKSLGYGYQTKEAEETLTKGFNPAEFVLEVVSLSQWKSAQKAIQLSDDYVLMQCIEDLIEAKEKFYEHCEPAFVPTLETPCYIRTKLKIASKFTAQLPVLLQRSVLKYSRDIYNLVGRLAVMILVAVLVGLAFGSSENKVDSPNILVAQFFFLIVATLILPFVAIGIFTSERQFYVRESASRLYGSSAYFLANIIPEAIICFTSATLMTCIVYFWLGFRADASAFFKALVVFALNHFNGALMVIMSSLTFTNTTLALVIGGAEAVVNLIFSGVIFPIDEMPNWISWLQYICSARYAQSALIVNEFDTNKVYNFYDVPYLNETQAIVGACGDLLDVLYPGVPLPDLPADIGEKVGFDFPARDMLDGYTWSYAENVAALVVTSVLLNIFSYLALRFFTKDVR